MHVLRIEAAKAAVRFEKPPLASVAVESVRRDTSAQAARRAELRAKLEETMQVIRRKAEAAGMVIVDTDDADALQHQAGTQHVA